MQTSSSVSFNNTSIAFSSKTDQELQQDYWLFLSMNNKPITKLGTNIVKFALKFHLPVKNLIKKTLFSHFCGGESIHECENTIQKLYQYGIGTILDYAVEGEDDDDAFDFTMREIMRTIDRAQDAPQIPFSVFKPTGIASKELLEKIQRKKELDEDEKKAFHSVRERFENICSHAHKKNVRVLVDSEDSWYQDPIDALVYEMMRKYNKEQTIVYNTYQMYRKGMMDNLRRAYHYSATHNHYLGAKLVRGAYMEKERERAKEYGYQDPILPTKNRTDEEYDKALRFCIDNKQRIALCSGSHNENSNYYLTVLMEKYSLKNNDPRVFFAQLYGMSDHISFNLSEAGYNVAKYVPYGPVKAVMPYLFRRAEENTSVAGQTSRELSLLRTEIERRRKAD